MSKSTSLYTTVAALKAADLIIGNDRVWNPSRPEQVAWLDSVYARCRAEIDRIPEIKSNATWSAEEHVAFLAKNGWEAQVTRLDPDQFATAGVMDLGVTWLKPGDRASVMGPDRGYYPGVEIEDEGVQIFRAAQHDQPVALLKTTSADEVWLTKVGQGHESADPAALASKLLLTDGTVIGDFDGIRFPMVDLAQKTSLDHLVGLSTTAESGQRAHVAEAVQQLTFKMNELGARARAADEMRVTLESCFSGGKPKLVIDGPFLLAIKRPGLSLPLFTTLVTEEDWKRPESL